MYSIYKERTVWDGEIKKESELLLTTTEILSAEELSVYYDESYNHIVVYKPVWEDEEQKIKEMQLTAMEYLKNFKK